MKSTLSKAAKKFLHGGVAVVETLTEAKGVNYPPGQMLISTPQDIAAVLTTVPKGKVITMATLRQRLAEAKNADYTCAMTTGIFARVVADYVAEQEAAGEKAVAPYWRLVKNDGLLNEKFPNGVAGHMQRLEAEGHTFKPKGSKNFVLQNIEKVAVN